MRIPIALLALGACAAAPERREPPTPPSAPAVIDVALTGEANGLLWLDGKLIVAEFATNQMFAWEGKGDPAPYASIPVAGRTGLGQPARLPDGRIAVTRFGHGATGGVFLVSPNGGVTQIPGLEPKRQRVGLAAAADGTLYAARFEGHGQDGAIARLSLDGKEEDLLTGLRKPVGLLVRGDWLYGTDQGPGELFRCRLPACDKKETVATVPGADLIAAEGDVVYVATKDGGVTRVRGDGRTEVIAKDLGRVRGLAVDGAGRLYIAARREGKSFIRVMPIR